MNQDSYQSTNKLPENPYPERSHLLLEGVIDIAPSDYIDYPSNSGFYLATKSIDVTRLIQLGNRLKGFNPRTLEAKVWLNEVSSGGGQIDDYYAPLPILELAGYTTPSVQQNSFFSFHGTYIIADDTAAMFFSVTDVRNAIPGRTQSFSYKIYNTIYEFTDTL